MRFMKKEEEGKKLIYIDFNPLLLALLPIIETI
jgi:hypothetical protein